MNIKLASVFRSMRVLIASIFLSVTLAGCFDLNGEVAVEPDGNHIGGYVFSMNSAVYASMLMQDPGFLEHFKKFSNPSVKTEDGVTYIYDISGEASMLGFYDNKDCHKNGNRSIECSYKISSNDLDFPGWSVDWNVHLPKGVKVVRGNYQSINEEKDMQSLHWHFDGNKVSQLMIQYTIRMPNT